MSLQCRWGHTHFLLLITSYLVTYTKNKKIEHQISFFIQVHATFYTDFSSTKKLYLITISLFDFWKSNSSHLKSNASTKATWNMNRTFFAHPFLLLAKLCICDCFVDYELWLSILICFTDLLSYMSFKYLKFCKFYNRVRLAQLVRASC